MSKFSFYNAYPCHDVVVEAVDEVHQFHPEELHAVYPVIPRSCVVG